MAHIPRKKRTTGEDPPRGEYSRNIREERNAPRTKPGISGRRYCTTAARCRPSAPAMSRVKQATQKPILPGLPSLTSNTARSPKIPPATQGPWRDVSSLSIQNRPPVERRTECGGVRASRGPPPRGRQRKNDAQVERGATPPAGPLRRHPDIRSRGPPPPAPPLSKKLAEGRSIRPPPRHTPFRTCPFHTFIVADAPAPRRAFVVSTERIPRTTPPCPPGNRRYTEAHM